MPSTTAVGPLLRRWRSARGLSQLALAEQAEVSTRHISFVENGKAQPSREMVLVLASALDVPLRERNTLLTAAGFAPVYRESAIQQPHMSNVRRALDFIMQRQEPFPAIVVNRRWDLLMSNEGAQRLMEAMPPDPSMGVHARNAMHLVFHPGGLRRYIVNWDEVSRVLMARLVREATQDALCDDLDPLVESLMDYPHMPRAHRDPSPHDASQVLVPLHLRNGDVELRLFTTVASLGTPIDITAQELRIEHYYAEDDVTEAWFRSAADD
ncbi:MAG: helix-turn-helix transcriptional regulator [Deltaproteobacteria bacterium]|nr:helix-turn-helix transcriptional regulator [Deltaproteobacteria bacterium]